MDTQSSTHKNTKKRWLKASALLLLALVAGTIAYLASVESQARHLWKMRVQATQKSRKAKSFSSEYDSFMQEYGNHTDILIRRRVAEVRFHKIDAMLSDKDKIPGYADLIHEYNSDPDPHILELTTKAESERQWSQGLRDDDYAQLLLTDRKRLLRHFRFAGIGPFGKYIRQHTYDFILQNFSDDHSPETQELVMKVHSEIALRGSSHNQSSTDRLEAFMRRYKSEPMFWSNNASVKVFEEKIKTTPEPSARLEITEEYLVKFEEHDNKRGWYEAMMQKAEDSNNAEEKRALYDAVMKQVEADNDKYDFLGIYPILFINHRHL